MAGQVMIISSDVMGKLITFGSEGRNFRRSIAPRNEQPEFVGFGIRKDNLPVKFRPDEISPGVKRTEYIADSNDSRYTVRMLVNSLQLGKAQGILREEMDTIRKKTPAFPEAYPHYNGNKHCIEIQVHFTSSHHLTPKRIIEILDQLSDALEEKLNSA
jgi:hypothetical protein